MAPNWKLNPLPTLSPAVPMTNVGPTPISPTIRRSCARATPGTRAASTTATVTTRMLLLLVPSCTQEPGQAGALPRAQSLSILRPAHTAGRGPKYYSAYRGGLSLMKVFDAAGIRNVAVVGHSGAGKTQLASA